MFTRRGFIRVSAASVGSLALRPFGLLPALAQSGPNYRALVCVFLFGGNDSNNTIIPMDDTNFQAYTSIRGSLALTPAELTPTVYSGRRAVRVSRQAAGAGEHVFVEGAGGGGERRVAGAAADAGAVSGRSRRRCRSICFRTPISSCNGRPRSRRATAPRDGPAARPITSQSQKINSSNFPAFFSVAGNALLGTGRDHAAGRDRAGRIAAAHRIQSVGGVAGAVERADQPAEARISGVSLAQAANNTLSNSISDATALASALAKGTPLKTQFPDDHARRSNCSRWRRSFRCRAIWG